MFRVLNKLFYLYLQFTVCPVFCGSGSRISGSDPDTFADPDPDPGSKVRSGSGQKDPDPKHCNNARKEGPPEKKVTV